MKHQEFKHVILLRYMSQIPGRSGYYPAGKTALKIFNIHKLGRPITPSVGRRPEEVSGGRADTI